MNGYVESEERALLREARELGREAREAGDISCPYGTNPTDPFRRQWFNGFTIVEPTWDSAPEIADIGWTCSACGRPGNPSRWEEKTKVWEVCPTCGHRERIR